MTFIFGLGSNNLQSQYRQDASTFKLSDISNNIQKRISGPTAHSSGYLDYTASHLTALMQKDQENDDNATFLFEYQALLRTRIQQLITDLTAALTRDLDGAMAQARPEWGVDGQPRKAMQGFGAAGNEDAGAARTSFNFMAGFAHATPISAVPTDHAYNGSPTVNADGSVTNRVSPDTSADKDYGSLRVVGTAAFQLSIPDDDVDTTVPVIDSLNILTYGASPNLGDNVLYRELGGGFVAHKNRYRLVNVDSGSQGLSGTIHSGAINGTNAYTTAGLLYTNQNHANNLNDNNFEAALTGNASDRYNNQAQNKNEFQKVLYEAILELDHRGLLRDIFRLSERYGFLNDVSIASTSSMNTGSQVQANIALNFVPRSTGGVLAGSTTTSAQVTGGATNFSVGEIAYVTVGGDLHPVRITAINSDTSLSFTASPPLSAPPDTGTTIVTSRPDLGGSINIGIERWLAYWHS